MRSLEMFFSCVLLVALFVMVPLLVGVGVTSTLLGIAAACIWLDSAWPAAVWLAFGLAAIIVAERRKLTHFSRHRATECLLLGPFALALVSAGKDGRNDPMGRW